MKRRELMLLLLGGGLTAARGLRAQQKAMPVIGVLNTGSPGPSSAPFMAAFRQGLSETGYVEGQNLAIEYRLGGGPLRSAARFGRRSCRPQGGFVHGEQPAFGTSREKCDPDYPNRL